MPLGFFKKEGLPSAESYYRKNLKSLGRPNSKGWALANCVFHQPDKNPSLSVNIITGGFRCFACGASGGDVLDFHRLLTGQDFQTACKTMGAWEFSR